MRFIGNTPAPTPIGKKIGTILDEEVGLMAVPDRTYQASDLAGTGRREFLDRAKGGAAYLRDTDGTPLVMLPEGNLAALQSLTRWIMTYLAVETALGRSRDDRRPTDFGDVAWASTLDEGDLAEMLADFRSALSIATSQLDPRPVEILMRDWRYTAVDLANPFSGPILRGEHADDDFVEAAPPGAVL